MIIIHYLVFSIDIVFFVQSIDIVFFKIRGYEETKGVLCCGMWETIDMVDFIFLGQKRQLSSVNQKLVEYMVGDNGRWTCKPAGFPREFTPHGMLAYMVLKFTSTWGDNSSALEKVFKSCNIYVLVLHEAQS